MPALSRKEGGFAKLSYEQNSLADLGSPQASLGYNANFSDNLAVFGVLTYKEEKFRRDSITVNSWGNRLGAIQLGNQAAAGSNPVYDSLIAQYPGRVYYPSQTRQLVLQTDFPLVADGTSRDAPGCLRRVAMYGPKRADALAVMEIRWLMRGVVICLDE